MSQPLETPKSRGLRLLELVRHPNCPQDEALALIAAGADAKISYGTTVLHRAALRGQTAIVIALLEKGADIGVKNDDGDTALHWAAMNGRTDVILAFIERGAEIDAKNKNGDTAETLARQFGHAALADRIRAANLERATEAFRTGTKNETAAPPPLRVKKRSPAP